MLLQYLGKLKIQIFCGYSADVKAICIFIASNFVIHPQFLIFSVFKIGSFPHTDTDSKENFPCHCYFTCLLLQSICGTRNSSQQCLSTINMVYSDKNKILIKTDKYTQNTVIRKEEIKFVHLKCNYLQFLPYLLNIYRKFDFLISRDSVATCLRRGG